MAIGIARLESELLLNTCAQVNSKVEQKAPILWAIQASMVNTLKCLLDHHADVNILVSATMSTQHCMIHVQELLLLMH